MPNLEATLTNYLQAEDGLHAGPAVKKTLNRKNLEKRLQESMNHVSLLIWVATGLTVAVVLATIGIAFRFSDQADVLAKVCAAPALGLMGLFVWLAALIKDYWRMSMLAGCIPYITDAQLRALLDKILFSGSSVAQDSRPRDPEEPAS